MPTYEYECKACAKTFEVFQSMSDEPIGACPECGKPVRRLIGGGTGVIFKGTGFYKNDSRKAASGASSKPASGDAPKSSSGDSPSSPEPAKKEAV